MSGPTRAGLMMALVIVVAGVTGMAKLGRFHWGVFAITVATAVFSFVSQRNKARLREQYPNGPPRSIKPK